ncbi:hypothetical protein TNCV_48291 [Trichonephila clavipes]|nr:hypothetical protein TNCV_48291 [Trichonephila clavipes]
MAKDRVTSDSYGQGSMIDADRVPRGEHERRFNAPTTNEASCRSAFQCNNHIVMVQRKHLDDFLCGGIIGRLEWGRTQLKVSEELEIA